MATRPAPTPPAELAVPCPKCEIVVSTPFCPNCGTERPTPSTTATEVLDALERRTTPFGDVVLARDLQADFSRRLTVRSGEDGTLAEPDRQRLLDALWETLDSDGYLYATLRVDGGSAGSLWHVINGFLIPLTSEHAAAVLGLYPSLMPDGTGAQEAELLADAPDLTLDGE